MMEEIDEDLLAAENDTKNTALEKRLAAAYRALESLRQSQVAALTASLASVTASLEWEKSQRRGAEASLAELRKRMGEWGDWLKVERDLARGCHIEGVCACCLDKINSYNRRLEQTALASPPSPAPVESKPCECENEADLSDRPGAYIAGCPNHDPAAQGGKP
jgi:hypothetical protein